MPGLICSTFFFLAEEVGAFLAWEVGAFLAGEVGAFLAGLFFLGFFVATIL